MWFDHELASHLEKKHKTDVWREKIFPTIQQCIKWSLVCAQDKIEPRKNSFELYGYDFVIDSTCKPWLIEANKTPALDHSTKVTQILIPKMLEDIIKVVIDYPCACEKSVVDTGNFELYYQQNFRQDKKCNSNEKGPMLVEGSRIDLNAKKTHNK
jgi:tubulin monoglycylase TTLL3/8